VRGSCVHTPIHIHTHTHWRATHPLVGQRHAVPGIILLVVYFQLLRSSGCCMAHANHDHARVPLSQIRADSLSHSLSARLPMPSPLIDTKIAQAIMGSRDESWKSPAAEPTARVPRKMTNKPTPPLQVTGRHGSMLQGS
jgi:hypothetical protein